MFSFSFDESLISYSTAVAYMAYCFLQLGLNNKDVPTSNTHSISFRNFDINKAVVFLSVLFLVLLLYFILNGGLMYFADQFIYSGTEQDRFMGYIVQFITPIAYAILILAFMLPNKKSHRFYFAICLIFFYVLAILSTGSRTIPLSLIIMTIFLYNDRIKKLGMARLIILGVAFGAIMVIAGALRGEGELISGSDVAKGAQGALDERSEHFFSYANELIICNRNLYFLIQSTETVSYTYGLTLLGSLLSMVPFLRSIFMSVTGVPEYVLNSALYNTFLSTGPRFTKGLGTHAVADIYICWGIIGVIIVFFLYGYIISKLKYGNGGVFALVAYYVILSNSVYACRASILNLNQIVWTIAIVYLMMRLFGKRNKHLSIK